MSGGEVVEDAEDGETVIAEAPIDVTDTMDGRHNDATT